MSTTSAETATAIRPFHVEFSERIDDLRRRIAATRWPSKELVDGRSQGVQLAAARAVARYWLDEYDFGRVEARLNELPQFITQIDGVDIHFIHVKSQHENAVPLIMTHGWPGSVIELLDAIGPLSDPTAHGGSDDDAFHLVLPSLPGYGFSAEPPCAVGFVNGPMVSICSTTEPGQPWVMISGSASSCGERTWMKWMSTPSISVTNWGSAFSRASMRPKSYSSSQ